jgi:lipid-binding SYLF domain-containing protein
MKNTITIIFFLFMFIHNSVLAQKYDVEESNKTIAEFKEKDSDIHKFFDSSYGYAVLYSVGKGAIGIGGAGGKGTVYEGGTPIGDVRMTQVTIGFALGGQKYAEVIFFKDNDAYDRFVSNKFEFSSQVSAVALSSGASANAKYRDGVVVFTMAIGGLMYEASIGGQKFKVTLFGEEEEEEEE